MKQDVKAHSKLYSRPRTKVLVSDLTGITVERAVNEVLRAQAEAFSKFFVKNLPNFSHYQGQAILMSSYEGRVNKYFQT